MREIKFRYRFQNIYTREITTTILTIEQVEIQGLTPNPFGNLNWTLLSRDEYIGLKDKNGKEIYEGDIVSYLKENKVIEWDEHVAGFSWKGQTQQEYLMLRKLTALNCEIIGNIYKNPTYPGK